MTTTTRRVRQPQPVTDRQAELIAQAARVHDALVAADYRDPELVDQRRAAVVAAKDAGATCAAIADGLGIARQNVHRLLRLAGR